jgi:hypothetical protein
MPYSSALFLHWDADRPASDNPVSVPEEGVAGTVWNDSLYSFS